MNDCDREDGESVAHPTMQKEMPLRGLVLSVRIRESAACLGAVLS